MGLSSIQAVRAWSSFVQDGAGYMPAECQAAAQGQEHQKFWIGKKKKNKNRSKQTLLDWKQKSKMLCGGFLEVPLRIPWSHFNTCKERNLNPQHNPWRIRGSERSCLGNKAHAQLPRADLGGLQEAAAHCGQLGMNSQDWVRHDWLQHSSGFSWHLHCLTAWTGPGTVA